MLTGSPRQAVWRSAIATQEQAVSTGKFMNVAPCYGQRYYWVTEKEHLARGGSKPLAPRFQRDTKRKSSKRARASTDGEPYGQNSSQGSGA